MKATACAAASGPTRVVISVALPSENYLMSVPQQAARPELGHCDCLRLHLVAHRQGKAATFPRIEGAVTLSALCQERTSRLLRTSVTLAGMFIWRGCVRDEIGVWIAPAPIASQNIRPALFN